MAFLASTKRVMPDIATGLRFAAAPTFALMAVLNAMARDGRQRCHLLRDAGRRAA